MHSHLDSVAPRAGDAGAAARRDLLDILAPYAEEGEAERVVQAPKERGSGSQSVMRAKRSNPSPAKKRMDFFVAEPSSARIRATRGSSQDGNLYARSDTYKSSTKLHAHFLNHLALITAHNLVLPGVTARQAVPSSNCYSIARALPST